MWFRWIEQKATVAQQMWVRRTSTWPFTLFLIFFYEKLFDFEHVFHFIFVNGFKSIKLHFQFFLFFFNYMIVFGFILFPTVESNPILFFQKPKLPLAFRKILKIVGQSWHPCVEKVVISQNININIKCKKRQLLCKSQDHLLTILK